MHVLRYADTQLFCALPTAQPRSAGPWPKNTSSKPLQTFSSFRPDSRTKHRGSATALGEKDTAELSSGYPRIVSLGLSSVFAACSSSAEPKEHPPGSPTYPQSGSLGLRSDPQAAQVKGLPVGITTLPNHSPTQYVRTTEFLCNAYRFVVTWIVLRQRLG